ncbi:SDR family NAD(P)-dependent oxidoreductase [Oceanobacillus halophilus]|uniref:SDR family NAD(P)-dependent oxidoreductase n=1 Tax=Oceanobacillus halophilus TaxID=930130 RepID=A0A495A0D8_9BACI|nr:SDR family NAD(P)-dependent oxidoreductase [Oceanobacillus halophilus]RKQ32732.1 SDR family NAD(P)-dependent oxidoreductase [Oceanobacillus halophilus]
MKHVLVIGGTGMLSDVCLWLVNQNYQVSVIGRNPEKMQRLVNSTTVSSQLTPVLVDYTNYEALKQNLLQIQEQNGPFDMVVAWIHGTDLSIWQTLFHSIPMSKNSILYHVNGSRTNLEKVKRKLNVPKNISYHQIKLGFIVENAQSRWLTHEEISNGIIQAIEGNNHKKIIGVLEPWDKRP